MEKQTVVFEVGERYKNGERLKDGEFFFIVWNNELHMHQTPYDAEVFPAETPHFRAIQVSENPKVPVEPREGEWWMCQFPGGDKTVLTYRGGEFTAFASGGIGHVNVTPLYKVERAK